MRDSELSELKTDVALIKKDISQIEKFFEKLDTTIDNIVLISKAMAVQEITVKTHEKRLNDLDVKITRHHEEEDAFRKILQKQLNELKTSNQQHINAMKESNDSDRERRHKEVMNSINLLRDDLNKKNKEQDGEINRLQQWKWWSMGVGAAVVTIGSLIWSNIFG